MNTLSEHDLVELIVAWVKENGSRAKTRTLEINGDTDLVASGVLDSFGFVDLIVYLEAFGCRMDLTDADPAEFSVVKGLCRIALRNARTGQDGNSQNNR